MTDLIAHVQLLARYNRLANEALLDVCQTLSETTLLEAQGGSFGSILGTLNHLLIGDRIWLARFEGSQAASTGLGKMPYATLAAFIPEREATDARIEWLVANLEATWLAGTISYVNNQGRPYEDSRAMLLAHFFNHQTHHRGQIHVLLRQAGVPSLLLDMHRTLNP